MAEIMNSVSPKALTPDKLMKTIMIKKIVTQTAGLMLPNSCQKPKMVTPLRMTTGVQRSQESA
jgi:hypothetical protein